MGSVKHGSEFRVRKVEVPGETVGHHVVQAREVLRIVAGVVVHRHTSVFSSYLGMHRMEVGVEVRAVEPAGRAARIAEAEEAGVLALVVR